MEMDLQIGNDILRRIKPISAKIKEYQAQNKTLESLELKELLNMQNVCMECLYLTHELTVEDKKKTLQSAINSLIALTDRAIEIKRKL